MKKKIFLLFWCFGMMALTINAQPKTWYVDAAGTNNTASGAIHWNSACPDLGKVIDVAQSGDTILVAVGTYKGGFVMKEGVQVYGGFDGRAGYLAGKPATCYSNSISRKSAIDDTDLSKCSVLSSDLSISNANVTGTEHIWRGLTQLSNFSVPTVWDGFVIQNGSTARPGGGVSLMNNGIARNCIIRNCESIELPSISGLNFVAIPAGSFILGKTPGDADATDGAENNPNPAVYTNTYISDFWMSEAEITAAQYAAFLNAAGVTPPASGDKVKYEVRGVEREIVQIPGNSWEYDWSIKYNTATNQWEPRQAQYANCAISYVSLWGALAFCDFYGLRLPTEAEWEYAARGGVADIKYAGAAGNTEADLANVAYYNGNTPTMGTYGYPQIVKGKNPNAFGLYDMSGNVAEWTTGYIDYNGTTAVNPYPIPARVYSDVRIRGGNFTNNPAGCRVSARNSLSVAAFNFAVGFRVCR